MTEYESQSDTEQFTKCETDSVELEYSSGRLNTIHVTATWHRGYQFDVEDEIRGVVRTDKEVSINAVYSVGDGCAELSGIYPETSKTGRQLYRQTLDCLRVLPHIHKEVQERLDDNVNVEDPADAFADELTLGDDAL